MGAPRLPWLVCTCGAAHIYWVMVSARGAGRPLAVQDFLTQNVNHAEVKKSQSRWSLETFLRIRLSFGFSIYALALPSSGFQVLVFHLGHLPLFSRTHRPRSQGPQVVLSKDGGLVLRSPVVEFLLCSCPWFAVIPWAILSWVSASRQPSRGHEVNYSEGERTG